jgi:hypothetical protein
MSGDSALWRNTTRRERKVRNAYTPTCHVALEWQQCCLISLRYVRALYNRPMRYICRICAPEGYILIRILLGDTAFPRPVIIIQLSTYVLLVPKLKVCRCNGIFYFRILFMAALRPRKEVPLDSDEEGVRGFPDSAYSCIVFHLPLASVSLPNALVTSEGYHVVSLATLLWI